MSSKSVGIIYKHHHEPARTEALKLEKWFDKRGIKVFSEEMTAEVPQEGASPQNQVVPKDVDWIVVLAGTAPSWARPARWEDTAHRFWG